MKPDGENENEAKMSSLLGVGLDCTDGEVRLTRGPNFALVGGSQQTHEVMQETVCKVNEKLEKRGKTIPETTCREFYDVLQDVVQSINPPKE